MHDIVRRFRLQQMSRHPALKLGQRHDIGAGGKILRQLDHVIHLNIDCRHVVIFALIGDVLDHVGLDRQVRIFPQDFDGDVMASEHFDRLDGLAGKNVGVNCRGR